MSTKIGWACVAFELLVGPAAGAQQHPLDALQPGEYREVRDILAEAGKTSGSSLFALIRLDEPSKEDVLSWTDGDPIPRAAFAVVREGARMFEARVDLHAREVLCIDITKAVRAASMSDPTAAADTRYGTLIAPNLVGVFHDHFFSLRFDMDVDGRENLFVRDRIVRTRLPEGEPRRSLWTVHSEPVRTERAAQLDIDLEAPEQWRVQSSTAKNAMGNPTGYVVVPSANAYSQLSADDYPQRRAGFARRHLWVTPYDPAELFAAGDYPNQSRGEGGLPTWTARNRSIDGTDLVLWYTLGFHHITAAEDWPVLPAVSQSVTLRPFNFFDRSQVINLPPP